MGQPNQYLCIISSQMHRDNAPSKNPAHTLYCIATLNELIPLSIFTPIQTEPFKNISIPLLLDSNYV